MAECLSCNVIIILAQNKSNISTVKKKKSSLRVYVCSLSSRGGNSGSLFVTKRDLATAADAQKHNKTIN